MAGTMPRTALRYAVEHLDKARRDHYMSLKRQARQSVSGRARARRYVEISEVVLG
jgi:hypothetical protein